MGRMAERNAELEQLREENEQLHAEVKRLKARINGLIKKHEDK